MVRRDDDDGSQDLTTSRCAFPAGASPASVSVGAPSSRSPESSESVKDLTPRAAWHRDLRETIAKVNPVLRGRSYFATGNAAKRFNQLDTYVWRRLRGLRVKRKGRNLRPGETARWTRESFWNLGLHRLRGTVRYPEAA